MKTKRVLYIIELVYSVLLLLVCVAYVLWSEYGDSLGDPPTWLLTAVAAVLIPGSILLLKEGVAFIASLLGKEEHDA